MPTTISNPNTPAAASDKDQTMTRSNPRIHPAPRTARGSSGAPVRLGEVIRRGFGKLGDYRKRGAAAVSAAPGSALSSMQSQAQ
jgi:hypothetical protein